MGACGVYDNTQVWEMLSGRRDIITECASLVVGDYRQSSWDSVGLNYLPFDSLAQSVEQHTFNVKVRGSSPRRITIL